MTSLAAAQPCLESVTAKTDFLAGYGLQAEACATGECDLLVLLKAGLECLTPA